MDKPGAAAEAKKAEPVLGRNLNYDMRSAWYPLAVTEEIKQSDKKPFKNYILGDPVIIFRDKNGKARCLSDKCPHRSAPLSLGQVFDGKVE